MAAKHWTIRYGPGDRAEVNLETDEGTVNKFSIQYLALFNDWTPVVRYDTAHGSAHRDLLHRDGRKDTLQLRHYDLSEAFTYAVEDIRANWAAYRQRYEGERKL
jgi:hypothetical protein